jgi:AcrR family transcriptional regulator
LSGNSQSDCQTPTVPRARRATIADSRVRFTREVLGDALVALIQEWPFKQITVQDILDRAGVGRTTFYTHYADKQDLFLSDVEEFLEGMAGYLDRCKAPAQRLVPVKELFAHLADMTAFYKALNASGKITEIRELGITSFARSIQRRLAMTCVAAPTSELRVTSQALAGALFASLCHPSGPSVSPPNAPSEHNSVPRDQRTLDLCLFRRPLFQRISDSVLSIAPGKSNARASHSRCCHTCCCSDHHRSRTILIVSAAIFAGSI